MKVKNYPCLLTDEELKAEIRRLERKSCFFPTKQLFDLLKELKRRQQTPPPAEAAQ